MFRELISGVFSGRVRLPNKWSLAMGDLIRQAREDASMPQEELAAQIYKHRPAISEMERGKMIPDAFTLAFLAAALNKPLAYFIPQPLRREFKEESISTEEQELLTHFRHIWDEQTRQIAINQVRALAEMDIRRGVEEKRREVQELRNERDQE